MQPVDLTTLRAVQRDLAQNYLPARIETLQQVDLWTVCFCLRTLRSRPWVLLSWHPQAARVHLCAAPAKAPDAFQFSQILQRSLKGLVLTELALLDPWERILDWRFAPRPGDPPRWHLYLETMGKYSNAALVDVEGTIVASGHGVSERQSSVRPVQPGLSYQLPPALLNPIPSRSEPLASWQERVALLPGKLSQRLLCSYRGLSGVLVEAMLRQAHISPQAQTTDLDAVGWEALHAVWQEWLGRLERGDFAPGWTEGGYTVLGWGRWQAAASVHDLLEGYYRAELERDAFLRERQRLLQKLKSLLQKLYQRRIQFDQMLLGSERADEAKQAADLLMAHLQAWQPGMRQIDLPDFETGQLVRIGLDPEKNAVVNAQLYYKKHRKQKRAREAVEPLWRAVNQEIAYLEQVEETLTQLDTYRDPVDLQALLEIREELIQQKYLPQEGSAPPPKETNYRRFVTPSGLEVWVGRNNRQNETLTFRVAQDPDWWLHAQEIPGSHVLLRLPPGSVAEDPDLQIAADLAAHFSKGRLSEQVPVVYTRPKHVYKPKGSLPGMVVYKHERVLWGQPDRIQGLLKGSD